MSSKKEHKQQLFVPPPPGEQNDLSKIGLPANAFDPVLPQMSIYSCQNMKKEHKQQLFVPPPQGQQEREELIGKLRNQRKTYVKIWVENLNNETFNNKPLNDQDKQWEEEQLKIEQEFKVLKELYYVHKLFDKEQQEPKNLNANPDGNTTQYDSSTAKSSEISTSQTRD